MPTTSTIIPPTSTSSLSDVLARRPERWLDALAGPNHGYRLPVRVAGMPVETELTFGTAWRRPDGAVSRRILLVALTDAGLVSRRLPAVRAEIVVTADDRMRSQVEHDDGRPGLRRWFMRRTTEAVLHLVEDAAIAGRTTTTRGASRVTEATEPAISVPFGATRASRNVGASAA